ncbi:hypothetical protein Trydic_g20080 [Trypoxylus dichotomus]
MGCPTGTYANYVSRFSRESRRSVEDCRNPSLPRTRDLGISIGKVGANGNDIGELKEDERQGREYHKATARNAPSRASRCDTTSAISAGEGRRDERWKTGRERGRSGKASGSPVMPPLGRRADCPTTSTESWSSFRRLRQEELRALSELQAGKHGCYNRFKIIGQEDILDEKNVNDDHDTMLELLQKLPDFEDVTREDFIGRLDGDEKEELTDLDILNLATIDIAKEDDNTNDETAELKIKHDEGRQVWGKSLEYFCSQSVLTSFQCRSVSLRPMLLKQYEPQTFQNCQYLPNKRKRGTRGKRTANFVEPLPVVSTFPSSPSLNKLRRRSSSRHRKQTWPCFPTSLPSAFASLSYYNCEKVRRMADGKSSKRRKEIRRKRSYQLHQERRGKDGEKLPLRVGGGSGGGGLRLGQYKLFAIK